MKKNNVVRLLEANQIDHLVYNLPADKRSALETAGLLDIPPEMVFKTIVVVRHARGKSILAVVPGPTEVDLKALAKLLGEKKVFIASEREAEKLTGLLAGGISPLALLNRGFQVVMDDNALKFDRICISGGERGLMVALAPAAVIDLTSAITGKITPN